MPLQVLIIEDEILIAETIKLHLETQGHQVQAICISYEEAIAAYHLQQPDFVIIDIRLYGQKSGIDFAHFLNQQTEKIPFIYLTSQHDRRIFGLALETNPYGYLAKPIQKESLWTTVEIAYHRFSKSYKSEAEITIFDGQIKHRIKEKEILFIKSEHVYAVIYLIDNKKITTRISMAQIEEQITGKLFCRCHRSYIINTYYIHQWDSDSVTLINDDIIPISRSRKQGIMAFL